MRYTIFSIDDEKSATLRQSFEFMFKDDKRTVGNLIPLVGCYNGKQENSYICYTTDFQSFVKPMGFVANQESILRVSECNKKYTVLEYLDDRQTVSLGCMKSVTHREANFENDWTYRPDIDQYFITIHDNNNHRELFDGIQIATPTAQQIHAERCEARRAANGRVGV